MYETCFDVATRSHNFEPFGGDRRLLRMDEHSLGREYAEPTNAHQCVDCRVGVVDEDQAAIGRSRRQCSGAPSPQFPSATVDDDSEAVLDALMRAFNSR
jgi:hypothetical protein